ncbi:tetratricopeptide repeat protein [Marivivens marinus]|uniref:tetratricopeptide repeat protein n=1 Tax=Marivivens marinus TaxID=3110173 RepID=UPI003B84560D
MPLKTARTLLLAATLAAALPPLALQAEADAGSYLAARQAGMDRDFAAAARYFEQSLRGDPDNAGLLDSLVIARMALGDLDGALPAARRMNELGHESVYARVAVMTALVRDEDWEGVFGQLESGQSIGPLVDGLIQGWAFLGEGKVSRALDSFDEVADTQGLIAFGLYHKALALASVGDFEGADAIFSMPPTEGMQRTKRSALAHAEVLSQLGRNPDAVAMLDATFGRDPEPTVSALRARLAAGEPVPYSFVRTPQDGVAEVFFTVASAFVEEADESFLLLYTRAAELLRPDHAEALILTGRLLDRLGRHELANEAFSRISPQDPAFFAAEMGRADALRSGGKVDAAIEVLQALTRSHGEVSLVHATLGDFLRQTQDYAAANDAYTRALDLQSDNDPARWFVLYTRAITFERMDRWDEAEADFRASLALNPGHPSVLNYLGYSLVEKQIKLDEALSMIEQAVDAQPDNGAIVDSLGWVLYRLGRYDDAIVHMEHAAALEPLDPVINDHLGDVLWAVGREIEARFQWRRALSFNPEEAEAERIRRKLEVGLDIVLEEEGAAPLSVARDDR